MDHLDLGSAPSDEPCAQIGVDPDYTRHAKQECRAFINQLVRLCGEPPPGARFRIMINLHDFGAYYSVAIEFDPDDGDAMSYAYTCDEFAPREWDAAAHAELACQDGGALTRGVR